MATFIAFLTANVGLIITVVLGILSLLAAALNKNEKATGIINWLIKAVQFANGLQPKDSAGTLKRPFSKPAPAAPDSIMKSR